MSHAFPLVEASGSAFEIGYAHGAAARSLVLNYLGWIEKLTGKSLDVLCRNAMQLEPRMQAVGKAFLDEVRGLAVGAGISYEEAVLCQCRAEAAQSPDGACTAFALRGEATAGGAVFGGQNQDLEPEYADVGIILRVRPSDGRPRSLMFTFAGQIGYAGINEHGSAHFVNALYGYTWRPALPLYPIRRAVLESRTVAESVNLLTRLAPCSAANFVLCDGQRGIGDVEVTPEGTAVFVDEHPDAILHTNHYLTHEFAPRETHSLPDSRARRERLRDLVKAEWGRITVETLKTILADHQGDPAAICRHGATGIRSIAGYIAEPGARVMHIRRGHGCTGTWQAYEV